MGMIGNKFGKGSFLIDLDWISAIGESILVSTFKAVLLTMISSRHVTLGRQERRKKISLSSHPRPNQAPVESRQMTDTSTGNAKEQFGPVAPSLGETSTSHRDVATWAPEIFNTHPTGILNPQTIDAIFEHFDADETKRENELHPPICFYRDNVNEDNDILMSNLSFNSLPDLDESQRSALTFSPATSSDAPSILMRDRHSMTCESTMAIEGQDPATPSSLHELTITKKGKTVLTVEDLDPETRGEILNLLCQRKLITTIEIV
ncbi:MAG: hypothetical protein Q9167_005643 [Letrouitia subvulpina]